MSWGANQYSGAETEQLIEMVREHPCLYDPKLQSYRDAQLVAFWSTILTQTILVFKVCLDWLDMIDATVQKNTYSC